ncbi:flagellar biosynthesis regulator FlaF [Chthonobacter rhizosphaerae]|uniref:flagellar biosynthesis regulator FlaF n=1 Tax=Chthonobacter rhizosphaerae TaxID=2735553 RepID=UPI0015EEE41E|nr:flagellar biosynthesis regulator FlaF [Chthonobacter rhizosphaerae]
MYRINYAEAVQETAAEGRANERKAFEFVIGELRSARDRGPNSIEAVNAIYQMRRLWAILIEDLATPENGFQPALRADLISIGLFMLNHAERIRQGESSDFDVLIDLNQIIAKGLE